MTIAWIYLDKEMASVNALKDYAAMKHIVDNYACDMKESKEFLTTLPSPVITDMPRKSMPNVHSGESRVAAAIDRIDVVEERYQRAVTYMNWFDPAWNALSEKERHLLEAFFLHEELTRTEIVNQLCDELHREKSSVYRAKDKALRRLSLLLYGK